jgi:hypothetical protein
MRNKSMKKLVVAATVFAMGVTSILPSSQAQAAKVKKLKVNTKKITLYKGAEAGYGSTQLKVTVSPKKAKVTYKVSKKKIVSVTKKGLVKAKKPGKAKITVKAGNKKVTVKVTVKKIAKKVTKVTADKNITVAVGAKQKIKTSVKPKKATLKTLSFATNKKKVAKVSAKGVVTGVKEGNAKITVKAVDGSKKKATVAVVVSGGAVATTAPAITSTPAVTTTPAPGASDTDKAPTTTKLDNGATQTTVKIDKDTSYKLNITTASGENSALEISEGTLGLLNLVADTLDKSATVKEASESFKNETYTDAQYGNVVLNKAAGEDTATVKVGDDTTYQMTMASTTDDEIAISMKNESTQGDSLALKATKNTDGTYNVTDLTVAGETATGDFTATSTVENGTTTITLLSKTGDASKDTVTVSYKEGESFDLVIPEKYQEKYNINLK